MIEAGPRSFYMVYFDVCSFSCGFLLRKAGTSHFFSFASISSSTFSTSFLKSSAFLLVKALAGSSSLSDAATGTETAADFLFKAGRLAFFLALDLGFGLVLGLRFFFGLLRDL